MTNDSSTKSAIDQSKRDVEWRFLLVLWLVPLCAYLWLIGRWSLSGDEYYTLVDSSKPLLELLSYERKPLYYMLCHVLLQFDLGLPVETVIRLPAAFAASLIPPAFYVLLSVKRYGNVRVLAAVLALFNPWLFQMSQFARFYSLAFLFASIAILAGLRGLHSKTKKKHWFALFVVSGTIAALSQLPAGLVIPAGLVGLVGAMFRENPTYVWKFAKRFGAIIAVVMLVAAIGGFVFVKDVFSFWLSQSSGRFGNASAIQILMGLALGGGLSAWVLAFVPLVRSPISWTSDDIYLVITIVLSGFPLLVLVPFGGGVASAYLMFCLPGLFVLAAMHWRQVDERLPRSGYRMAVGLALISFNLPYLASVAYNGDHFDYRQTVAQIEAMDLDNPVVVSSAHQLMNYYFENAESEIDLATFEGGIKRHIVEEGIELATQENRPLLLVAREDRTQLSKEDQTWLYNRFALIATINRPRFDHRRHQMSIYQYRPAPGFEDCPIESTADHVKRYESGAEGSKLELTPNKKLEPIREPALTVP